MIWDNDWKTFVQIKKLFSWMRILKKKIVQTFQKNFEEKNLLYKNSFDFFVESYKILETDFTCTKIFRVVLFEPDFIQNDEKQINARISRFKQKNLFICSYRLLCLDTIKRQIIDWQNQWLQFQNIIFSCPAIKI